MREFASRETAFITGSECVRALPACSRHILRGGGLAMSAAGRTLGLSMPEAACRAAQQGPYAALWLGPDERLLLGPDARADEIAGLLEKGLRTQPHSLVDVSHRQIGLEVTGPHAATLLNEGCPLELTIEAFSVGMCTRTVFAKAEIVLWRTAEQAFRIEVARSFAAYVSRWLAEATRGML